jgi:hypothetical protein
MNTWKGYGFFMVEVIALTIVTGETRLPTSF